MSQTPRRPFLDAVPLPLRRVAGLWLLGFCLGLPAVIALFR